MCVSVRTLSIYNCKHSKLTIPGDRVLVVCTDLPGEEPYREVGIGSTVISGRTGGVMVSRLAQHVKDVSPKSCSRHNIPHVLHTDTSI